MVDVVVIAEIPRLPVLGSGDQFPVHRIYCVGRNYADHAIEMGHNPDEEPPFFFMKPADTILGPGKDFPYPGLSADVQHEVELVVALQSGGVDIEESSALDHVYGYAVGIDMTRRDLQNEAKKMGRPWESGKAFDCSAPCSAIRPVGKGGQHPLQGKIALSINGQTRQASDLGHLIWKVPQVIARLSSLFMLQPGDLIYTGTPAGVGAVNRGDHIQAFVEDVAELNLYCR
jgi:fumarylpyruvate hydrolase